MKTKTFLILRVVQVPTGVKQVALQKWIALLKTLDFSFLAARFFFPLFLGSLSPRVDSGSQEPRTAQCSVRVSRSLQPRGRWARSGKNASGRQQSAGVVARCAGDSRVDEREQFACEAVLSGGSQSLTGDGGDALLDVGSPAVPIDFAGQDHVPGYAGRQGVEQPALGTRWGFRPLTGALRQARKLQRCAIENLSSYFVPHSRLFSLHHSLVSQNSSLSHGSVAMNSCGFMHGVRVHDNSLVVHENSWGAPGHKNSCSSHAAGVRGGTRAPSTSTRVGVGRSAVEKLASPQQTSSKLHVEVWEGLFEQPRDEFFSGGGNCAGGVLLRGLVLHVLMILLSHLGQAESLGTCLAGPSWRKQYGLGYGCSGVPFGGRIFFLPSAQQETGLRKDRTTQRGRFLVIPRVLARTRTGEAPLSGLTLAGGAGHCLQVCGVLSHP